MGQRVKRSMSKQTVKESGDNGPENPKTEDADPEQSDWSITFEQFIASFLNESALVGKTITNLSIEDYMQVLSLICGSLRPSDSSMHSSHVSNHSF